MQSQYELKNPGNVDRMLQEFYNTALAGRRSLQNPMDQTLISPQQFYDEFDAFIKGDSGNSLVQGVNNHPIIRNQQDAEDIRQLHTIMVEGRNNGDTLLKSEFTNSHNTPNAHTFSNRIMTLAKNEKKKQLLPTSPPLSPNESLIASNNTEPLKDIEAVDDELTDMLMMNKFRDFRTYRGRLGGIKETKVEKIKEGFKIRIPGGTIRIKSGLLLYSGNLNKLKPDKPKDVLKVQMMARLYARSQGDPQKLKVKLNKKTPKWINKQMAITLIKESNVKLTNIKMDKELEAEVIAALEADPTYNPGSGSNQSINAEHENSAAVPLALSSFDSNMEEPDLTTNQSNVTIDDDPQQVIITMEGKEYNQTTLYDDNVNDDIDDFDIASSNPLQTNSITVNGEKWVDDYEDMDVDYIQIKTPTPQYQEDSEWDDDDEDDLQTEGSLTM